MCVEISLGLTVFEINIHVSKFVTLKMQVKVTMYNIRSAIRWQIPDFLSDSNSNICNFFLRFLLKIATSKVCPSKFRSRSRSTIFAMISFDDKYQNLQTSSLHFFIFAKVQIDRHIHTHTHTHINGQAHSQRRNRADLPKNCSRFYSKDITSLFTNFKHLFYFPTIFLLLCRRSRCSGRIFHYISVECFPYFISISI